MSPREAAEILGCDPTTVTRYIRQGKIKAKKKNLKKTEQGYGKHKYRWVLDKASVKAFAKIQENNKDGRGRTKKSDAK